MGHQYILGGENLSMGEVTRILSELTGIPAPRVQIPPRLLVQAGRVAEWFANRVTHRTPIVDVEAALHALSNRAADSGKAEKELGYRCGRADVALAKAAGWFLDNGFVREKMKRRISAEGRLQSFLDAHADEI